MLVSGGQLMTWWHAHVYIYASSTKLPLAGCSLSSGSSFLAPHPNSFSLPDHPNPPRSSSSLPSKRKPFSNTAANANLTFFSHSAPSICTTQFYTETDVLSMVLTSSRLSKLDAWRWRRLFKNCFLMFNTTSNQNASSLRQGLYSFS